jgi:hypothetical protein
VKKLGQKIEELQAKASTSRSQAPSHVLVDEDLQRKSAQQTIRATMSALLSQPEPVDAAGTQRIHDLVRQFVENSRDRQSQVETYLDRVEESLTPGLQAKFAMWGQNTNSSKDASMPGRQAPDSVDGSALMHAATPSLPTRSFCQVWIRMMISILSRVSGHH